MIGDLTQTVENIIEARPSQICGDKRAAVVEESESKKTKGDAERGDIKNKVFPEVLITTAIGKTLNKCLDMEPSATKEELNDVVRMVLSDARGLMRKEVASTGE